MRQQGGLPGPPRSPPPRIHRHSDGLPWTAQNYCLGGSGPNCVCVGCLFLRTPSRAPYRTPCHDVTQAQKVPRMGLGPVTLKIKQSKHTGAWPGDLQNIHSRHTTLLGRVTKRLEDVEERQNGRGQMWRMGTELKKGGGGQKKGGDKKGEGGTNKGGEKIGRLEKIFINLENVYVWCVCCVYVYCLAWMMNQYLASTYALTFPAPPPFGA